MNAECNKILLINPTTPSFMPNKEFLIPQGLLYLASFMQSKEIEVDIFDFNIYKPWENSSKNQVINELMDVIAQKNPRLLGFGCLFSGQFSDVLEISNIIKKLFPQLPIVLGGMHPTIFYKEILEHCEFVDFVIIGEGEHQLEKLFHFLTGNLSDLEDDSDGIAFRKHGEIKVVPKTKYIQNLDELPFPAYNLLDFSLYKHNTSHWHNPKNLPIDITIPIISSRSCPCKCNFCSMYLIGGSRFRARSPQNVVDEIQYLYLEKGIRHFNFMDDNLTMNKKRIIEICELICKYNLNIQFETLNGLMVNTLDDNVIDALFSAGWVRGALAIESGSDYIRNIIMKKNLTEEKIFKVIDKINKLIDVWVKAYFIIGMPEDTDRTLSETYKMIQKLDVNEVYVTNVVPFPGTPLFNQSLENNLFIDDVNLDDLWRNGEFYMTNKDKFYIRTNVLDLSDLQQWRRKFDVLLAEKYK